MPLHYEGNVSIHKIPGMTKFDNNGYLVICPSTLDCIVIDAPGEPEKLLKEVEGLNVKSILITHGHSDHIAGLKEIKEFTGALVGIGGPDAHNILPDEPDFYLTDQQEIQFGKHKLTALFTPGHTPGHQSVLVNLPKTGHMLFTGDACYTGDHWCDKCLPGLVSSSSDAAASVKKLRRVAKEHDAKVVWGHDPVSWPGWKKAPMFYYD